MIDRSKDARNDSANIVSLGHFLEDSDPRFRQAVVNALTQEGFDTDEQLPNLQLLGEILESIQWLESHGHGHHWNRFESRLHAAKDQGILIDVSAFGRDNNDPFS